MALTASVAQAALAQESAPPSSDPAGSTAPAGEPTLLGPERGPVAAGRYVDRSIGRDVTFSIGDGWLSNGAIEGAGFALIREDADWEAFLAESMGVLESLEISPLAS